MSKKLINEVKRTDKKIKQLLLEYNSFRGQLNNEGPVTFHQLTFDKMKQQGTFNVNESGTETNGIPSSIRRHAIEMLNLHKRSKEEKVLLSNEMKRVFDYFLKEVELSSKDAQNRYEVGSIALLKAEHKLSQNRVVSIYNCLKDYVTLPVVDFPTYRRSDDDEDTSSSTYFEDDEQANSSDSENHV